MQMYTALHSEHCITLLLAWDADSPAVLTFLRFFLPTFTDCAASAPTSPAGATVTMCELSELIGVGGFDIML